LTKKDEKAVRPKALKEESFDPLIGVSDKNVFLMRILFEKFCPRILK